MFTAIGLYSTPSTRQMAFVLLQMEFLLVAQAWSIGVVCFGLITAALDLLMTHWCVSLSRRMIFSGAAVGFLVANLERHVSKVSVAVAVVGGLVAPLCIWLSRAGSQRS
jgi:hypothetical protein